MLLLNYGLVRSVALHPGEGRGGGVLPKNGVGVYDPLPKTVTLFMTKVCDIPYPIYD